MPPTNATVAIGVPVYNGARYLRQAVESLLGQTWRDLEVVLSDNASTDETPDIARDLVARDARVRYHRNEQNLGVFRNYDRALELTTAPFFKWAASNDLCGPGHIAACMAVLQADPAVCLAYPGTCLFQDDPADATPYDLDPEALQDDPVDRFRHILSSLRLNNAFNGVYRSDALRRTSLNGEYLGSDMVVVAEIALQGKVKRAPGRHFYRRMTPEAASAAMDPASRRAFFAGTGRDVHGTPVLDRNLQLMRAIRGTPLTRGERRRAWWYMAHRLWWSRHDVLAETGRLLVRPRA